MTPRDRATLADASHTDRSITPGGARPIAGLPAIYFDQDGVVADFEAGKREVLGPEAPDLNRRTDLLSPAELAVKELLYATIERDPAFYRRLPPLADGVLLFKLLEPLSPGVLTAAPSHFAPKPAVFAAVADEKRAWCTEVLDLTDDRRFACTTSAAKGQFVGRLPGYPQILIDDRAENCASWEEAGGLAIHHVSFSRTLEQLIAIFQAHCPDALAAIAPALARVVVQQHEHRAAQAAPSRSVAPARR